MSKIVFSYKGLNQEGVETCGAVEAVDKEDALKKIQELKERYQNISIESAAVSTKKCRLCAEEIQAEAIKCKHCGASLNEHPKTDKADVEQKINQYLKKGFIVQHRDEYRIQLTKPKKFSWFFFFLWSFCGVGVGAIPYLFYYWWQKKDTVATINF